MGCGGMNLATSLRDGLMAILFNSGGSRSLLRLPGKGNTLSCHAGTRLTGYNHLMLGKVLEEKGITKYRFAKLLGKSTSNVAVYFRKGYKPNLTTLEAWAGVLGCSVRDSIEE